MADIVTCDCCGLTISKIRYKCQQCINYDLCSSCYETNKGHVTVGAPGEQINCMEPKHLFLRIEEDDYPASSSAKFTIATKRADTANLGNFIHAGSICVGCKMNPIVGFRFSCATCADTHLCDGCERTGLFHDPFHPRIKTLGCYTDVPAEGGQKIAEKTSEHQAPSMAQLIKSDQSPFQSLENLGGICWVDQGCVNSAAKSSASPDAGTPTFVTSQQKCAAFPWNGTASSATQPSCATLFPTSTQQPVRKNDALNSAVVRGPLSPTTPSASASKPASQSGFTFNPSTEWCSSSSSAGQSTAGISFGSANNPFSQDPSSTASLFQAVSKASKLPSQNGATAFGTRTNGGGSSISPGAPSRAGFLLTTEPTASSSFGTDHSTTAANPFKQKGGFGFASSSNEGFVAGKVAPSNQAEGQFGSANYSSFGQGGAGFGATFRRS